MKKVKRIEFFAKCSDLFNCDVYDNNDVLVKDFEGYPFEFLGHDGIKLSIDVKTGKILNWDGSEIQKYLTDKFIEQE